MSEPLAFQTATVRASLAALLDRKGARRFLVADEVGLGKTIVARQVARGVQEASKGPITILYLCPSLEIANQNKEKLRSLTGLSRSDFNRGADRLSLALLDPPPAGGDFRIMALTPDTSLPGWKPGVRTGRKRERQLIGALLSRCFPALWRDIESMVGPAKDPFAGHEDLIEQARPFSTSFAAAFRDLLAPGGTGFDELEDLVRRKEIAELILRARCALALTALRHADLAPDLIIVDEFHRFGDLLQVTSAEENERHKRRKYSAAHARIHGRLIDALLRNEEDERPALLMLSATPYRLQKVNGDAVAHSDRYETLIRLVCFLYGKADAAKEKALRSALDSYHTHLHSDGSVEDVAIAKQRLERLLRPVIARTERALAVEDSLFVPHPIPVKPSQADLVLFRHFARCLTPRENHLRGFVAPLWASVPYPAQTLHPYAVWAAIKREDLPHVHADGVRRHAHPQLRHLNEEVMPPDRLSLPWQPPTMPWWPLHAAWQRASSHGKALLFSRYRASPTAISALMSRGVEQKTPQGGAFLRLGSKPNPKLLAMFYPWPRLSAAIDPLKEGAPLERVRNDARRQLSLWLKSHGYAIAPGKTRDVANLVLSLETKGSPAAAKALFRGLSGKELERTITAWGKPLAVTRVSTEEIRVLADFLLGAPGLIVARTLRRHGLTDQQRPEAFSFCWHKLRPYLGHRHFKAAIMGKSSRGFPDSLMRMTVVGGLEAVLDEHLALLQRLYDRKGDELVDDLNEALLERAGQVRIRGVNRKDKRIRVHAATPFTGGVRKSKGGRDGVLRSDSLRRAFNSPFWPHLLATTSVGQEGLDFHVWCDQIVHWDMPRDPVEFEQREGRVSRYASLAVRRGLVTAFGSRALSAGRFSSPFTRLLELARADDAEGDPDGGLRRWWVGTVRPRRITFDWPFSLRRHQQHELERMLVYYRLALGQPDPELFLRFLQNQQFDADTARSLALNLSPALDERDGLSPETRLRMCKRRRGCAPPTERKD